MPGVGQSGVSVVWTAKYAFRRILEWAAALARYSEHLAA
jgi:hypothetical protein